MAKKLGDFVAAARANIDELTADDLEEMIQAREDLLVLDVREPDEYAHAHIEGAVLVPRGTLEGAADPNYKKRHPILCQAQQRPIVIYCETGGRSAMAAHTLKEMGFAEVYNLGGGIEMWEAEDYPVVEGDGA